MLLKALAQHANLPTEMLHQEALWKVFPIFSSKNIILEKLYNLQLEISSSPCGQCCFLSLCFSQLQVELVTFSLTYLNYLLLVLHVHTCHAPLPKRLNMKRIRFLSWSTEIKSHSPSLPQQGRVPTTLSYMCSI